MEVHMALWDRCTAAGILPTMLPAPCLPMLLYEEAETGMTLKEFEVL